MLASLLPGLRDLRVPLATGVLWLVVVWLATYPSIPHRAEATGLVAELYRLGEAFGPTLGVAVLSFVAYVVGILTARPTAALSRGVVKLLEKVVTTFRGPDYLFPASVRLTESSAQQAYQHVGEIQLEQQERIKSLADNVRGRRASDESVRIERALAAQEAVDVEELLNRMAEDVPLVATRLLAEHRDLFDRYDRADAESAFRFSIAPPLVIISMLLAWRLDLPLWGWLIAAATSVVAAALLLQDGVRKERESNDAIYQAVFAGSVEFPSIEAIRANLTLAEGGRAPFIVGGAVG